jgi:amino acid transporter
MTTPTVLERKTMGTPSLTIFACAASALMVVLVGSIPATYASTGVIALPLLFLLVGVVIALLSVGYTAMARRVRHPAVYYAAIAHGLGRPMGLSGGLVALLAYNAILISQFGLFGFTASNLFGFGPWWFWALVAAAIVALFGVRHIAASTIFLAIVFGVGLVIVGLFDTTALSQPAGGHLTSAGLSSAGLTGAVGGGVAYVIASLMGFELPGAFTEERQSDAAPSRAIFIALGTLVGIYTITSYALVTYVGPDGASTADPLSILQTHYSSVMQTWANLALLLAIITSMLAFHSTINRYVLAISREQVLPRWLASTGKNGRGNSPVAASLAQTAISVMVIIGFAVVAADPMRTLFGWFSALGALGLLALLILTSLAALIVLPRAASERAGVWTRLVAPLLGLIGGAFVFAEMLFNLGALLGSTTGVTRFVIPLVVLVVAVIGLIWGNYLRTARPQVYREIGRGLPDTAAVVDARLSHLPL